MDITGHMVTVAEAAAALAVGETTVRYYVRRGRLRAVRVGQQRGPYLIPYDEVERHKAARAGRARPGRAPRQRPTTEPGGA